MLSTFYTVDVSDVPNEPEGFYYTVNIIKAPQPFFIGIYFVTDENGLFVVKKIRKGTPAEQCGQIQKGSRSYSILV